MREGGGGGNWVNLAPPACFGWGWSGWAGLARPVMLVPCYVIAQSRTEYSVQSTLNAPRLGHLCELGSGRRTDRVLFRSPPSMIHSSASSSPYKAITVPVFALPLTHSWLCRMNLGPLLSTDF